MTMPCPMDPTIFPNVHGKANGIITTSQYRRMLLIGFGFSYGCAAFTLKNPPPLSPSTSIGCWLATGPPGIVWVCVT